MRAVRKTRWNVSEAQERGRQLQQRCSDLVTVYADAISEAVANFSGIDFLDGREAEIWTPLFVLCELFCGERRHELERAAADLRAVKRRPPKTISAAEANRIADGRRDGERAI